jgi:UDP-glucose 4-epimerase
MAFHKFLKAAVQDRPITVFGDGEQTRDFTYIDDIVDANLAALTRGRPGEVYNVGGGHRRILKDLFPIFEKVSGRSLRLEWQKPQKGDVPHTSADIKKAALDLGYAPKTALEYGLEEEWKWIKKVYKEG